MADAVEKVVDLTDVHFKGRASTDQPANLPFLE
jgi:hypothetical protein